MAPRFTAETVVAEAIAADPGVIDRLVAFNPTFKKLRNPVLRKVMARLVNFGDAAKVAGVPLAALLAAANGEAPPAAAAPSEPVGDAPAWIADAEAKASARLDVRPLLAAGEEPLGAIMRAAATVKAGEYLVLDAPFDPAPLRRVLANKGFAAHPHCLAADHWRVYFRREGRAAEGAPAETAAEGARIWREGDGMHIDVRGLAPPQPMLAILKLIEAADTGDVVIVHHEREPVFLFPELAERRWAHETLINEPGEVRLRLTREAA